MSLTVFLDTGPLGLLTNPNNPAATIAILRWANDHIRAGNQLMVPAIADFELRRELVRLGRHASIAELDAWNSNIPNRYVPLHDSALRLAANL